MPNEQSDKRFTEAEVAEVIKTATEVKGLYFGKTNVLPDVIVSFAKWKSDSALRSQFKNFKGFYLCLIENPERIF